MTSKGSFQPISEKSRMSGPANIADIFSACQYASMEWIRWIKKETRNPFWNVQPPWVKLITVAIAIPAWLVFAFVGVIQGDVGSPYADAAGAVFASTAVLQMIFVGKALWNHDI